MAVRAINGLAEMVEEGLVAPASAPAQRQHSASWGEAGGIDATSRRVLVKFMIHFGPFEPIMLGLIHGRRII